MKKSILIVIASILVFGVLSINTQAAMVSEQPNIWSEIAERIKQIFYPQQYSAFTYDVYNNSQPSTFNPFSQYQNTQLNNSNTASSDTSGYNCNQTNYTCVKVSSNAKYQGVNALNDCNKACKAPSSSSSNTQTNTNTNTYTNTYGNQYQNQTGSTTQQTQTGSTTPQTQTNWQTQNQSQTQTGSGNWQTSGGYTTTPSTGANQWSTSGGYTTTPGASTNQWSTSGGYNTTTPGAANQWSTSGGYTTTPSTGANQWSTSGGYNTTTPGASTNQWSTSGGYTTTPGASTNQWSTTGGTGNQFQTTPGTSTGNQPQIAPSTGTGNLWTGFFNSIKDLLDIPTTNNTQGDNKTTVSTIINPPDLKTSGIGTKPLIAPTNTKQENTIMPLGYEYDRDWINIKDACDVNIEMWDPQNIYKPGDVVWFKITMSNCRVNSQGYLGFEYQLASKTTEDLSSVYFHNEAHWASFVLPLNLNKEENTNSSNGSYKTLNIKVNSYQCLYLSEYTVFCLDDVKNRNSAHYKLETFNFKIKYLPKQEDMDKQDDCIFELVNPVENKTIVQHDNPLLSSLAIDLRVNCKPPQSQSVNNLKTNQTAINQTAIVEYNIKCRQYDATGDWNNYNTIRYNIYRLPKRDLSKSINYKIPGETIIPIAQLNFQEDLLRAGIFKECLLELYILQSDVPTITIKRQFNLDSCQIELKPYDINKEYHISKDLNVPMKMIFHCPLAAPSKSPTYVSVWCWDWMRYDPTEGIPGMSRPILSKNTMNSYNFNIPIDYFDYLFKLYLPSSTKYYHFNCWAWEYSFLPGDHYFEAEYDKTFFSNNFTKPLDKADIVVYNDGPYSPKPSPTQPRSTTTSTGGGSGANNQNVWQPKNWFQTIFAPIIRLFTR